ncbi:hypothetical protein FDECE_123 [Fusarium decemcellulare]|nr:hypothetical protein FDECE_123 [Fusarium decemcellulare]
MDSKSLLPSPEGEDTDDDVSDEIRTFISASKSEISKQLNTNQKDAHMCGYVLFLNLCGCYGELQFETSCARIFEELNRINDPESWTPETISELPFSFPDYCVPGWHNTRIILTYGVCCAQWWFDCPSVANPTYPYLFHPVDM